MKKYLALTIISLMFFANGNAQIIISTSLDEAINKAIEKNSSIKNKELEIEKSTSKKKAFGTNTFQPWKPAVFIRITTIN